MQKPPVDSERLWADLMALAAITDPDKPYTRRSFSPLFLKGRDWLKQRFEEAGLDVRLDAAANLIGRLDGSEPDAPVIMLGSHSDTVPSGGRFDGPAGVLAALEVVRAMKAAGYRPRHTIEIVDFLAEEPSEYGVSCVGSRAMAGVLDDKMLAYTNGSGETLAAAIGRVGGDVANLGRMPGEAISPAISNCISSRAWSCRTATPISVSSPRSSASPASRWCSKVRPIMPGPR